MNARPPGVPRLAPLLSAGSKDRARRARALLDAAPEWVALRTAIGRSIADDPARAASALEALRSEAERRADGALAARVRGLEGRAAHRAGRIADALRCYADAEQRLSRAGLGDEASAVGIGRVDALASSGRIDGALALADRLERGFSRQSPATLRASLTVNRANVLRLKGDLERAIALYDAAARLLDAAGSTYAAEVARFNGGVAALESGDVADARARFERAARVFRELGARDTEAQARGNLAWADVHAGRLGAAIRTLDGLAEDHRAGGLLQREGLVRLDLADALRRAGDLASAERQALKAATLFRSAGALAEAAEAYWFAASASVDSPVRVGRHLREARRAAVVCARPGVVVQCDVLLADVAARAGRPVSSRELASLARRARALGQAATATDVSLLEASAALDRGDAARARRLFTAVLRDGRARPWVRVSAETGIAKADASTPSGRARALARLRRVAGFLDAVRAELPGAWLRASFAAERLDPYLSLVDLLLERDRPADRREAERILGAVRARRFLAAAPPPRAARGDDRRLARSRARLEALYDRLARGEGPTRGSEVGFLGETTLEERARRWERAIAESWRRQERRSAAVAPVRHRAAAVLPRGAVRVHLWRRGDDVRALVRRGADVGPVVELGTVDDLEGFTDSLRIRAHRWALLRVSDPSSVDAAGFDHVLRDLADRVLPALGARAFPDDVRITSDPSLPDLPWELLPFDGARLGERVRILRVPAPSVAPPSRRIGRGTVVLGVGDPDLRGVEREVRDIAAAAGGAVPLIGRAATREAVLRALSTARVVHLAGHGWDAGEAPPMGGVRVADGWLTAADLPDGGLSAELVLLAACRTGRTSGRAHEAWGGLVPALLSRGVRRVVWTTDDVEDDTTARVMTRFHALRASCDDRRAFGLALARGAVEAGHVGSVLAFRLSGVDS